MLIFISIFFSTNVFSAVGFLSSTISQDKFDLSSTSSEVIVKSLIVNNDEEIREDLILEYELVRDIDKAIIYSDSEIFALGRMQARDFEKNINLNMDLDSGKYYLNINIKSPTQYPLAGFVHSIDIDSLNKNSLYLMKGPYFRFPISDNGTVIFIESHGTTGSNIDMGIDFELIFNLISNLEDNSNLVALIDVYPSYSDIIQESFEYKLADIERGVERKFTFPMNSEKPGTYNVVLSIYSGDEVLVSKDVRMVISGISGSIVRVSNLKDVYYPGDQVVIDADLVGPADGASILNDAVLELSIKQYGNDLYYFSNPISSLDTDVINSKFSFVTNDFLDEYLVRIVLSDGYEKIYDEVELSYEELFVDKVISEDGRIYDPTIVGCFDDNVCTDVEYSIGDCLDCYLKNENEVISNDDINPNKEAYLKKLQNEQFLRYGEKNIFSTVNLIIILINVVIFGSIFYIVWRKRKK